MLMIDYMDLINDNPLTDYQIKKMEEVAKRLKNMAIEHRGKCVICETGIFCFIDKKRK